MKQFHPELVALRTLEKKKKKKAELPLSLGFIWINSYL